MFFLNAVCTGVLLTVPESAIPRPKIPFAIPVPSREKKSTTNDHPSLGVFPSKS